MTREYLNEADVLVTYSNTIVPAGCILISTVVVVNNEVFSIDDGVRNNIANMVDPVTAATHAQLIQPHHPYESASDDRRIRLSTNWIVTDWATTDYTTYTTSVNLLDVGVFVVYINGVQSTIESSLDVPDGILTFAEAIFDSTSTDTPPTISVIFEGVQDVINKLPSSYLDPISAIKITKGIVTTDQIPQYNHLGRFEESLYPFQTALTYSDGFNYTSTIQSSTTFYDVINLSDGRILAATSAGMIINDSSGGNTWTTVLAQTVTKLHYSITYDWYLAIAGSLVYYTTDLVTWTPIDGMQGVNIVRDITEDNLGNIYASTDAGVQVLNPNAIVKVIWIQATIPNLQDTNTYALLYDFNADKLYVSCTDTLYHSSNQGVTWTADANNINVPLFSMLFDGTTLFACSNTNVWRRPTGQTAFTIVFSSVDRLRKLTLFGNQLYIISNETILNSDSTSNLLTDAYIPFIPAFGSININGSVPPVTCLTESNGSLFVGLDNSLYSTDLSRSLSLNGEINGVTPTIYVNGLIRNVGVSYSSTGVLFDEQLSPQDNVSIVTSYQTLYTKNGGWADLQYNATVFIHLNGVLYAVGAPVTTAQSISAAISSMVLTSFNARNSNYDLANDTLTSIVQLANPIDQLVPTAVVPATTLTQLFNLIQTFTAAIDPSLQANISLPPIGGSLAAVPAALSTLSIWQFNTDPSTLANSVGTFDAITGNIAIQTLTVDRYTKIQLSVKGVGIINTGVNTHSQLDDTFELVNSGLPAGMGFVLAGSAGRLQQLMGRLNSAYKTNYNLASDTGWYDTFNSTIDFSLQIEQDAAGIHLFYPADVLDLYDTGVLPEVWVCGNGGIVAINVNTFQTRKVYSSEFYIYNMQYANSVVNFLAQDGLYTIDPSTGIASKNVDFPLPSNYTSVYFINDNTLIATNTGLVSRRPFDTQWMTVVTINNAVVRGDNSFSFCAGQDPLIPANGQVYYSTGGGGNWSRSLDFPNLTINSVCQRYDLVYYATNAGLYVEDLSGLFSSSGQSIELVDLADDADNGTDISGTIQVNDVAADNTRMIAGDSAGNFYTIDGGVITATQSVLPAIHKVKLVNGQYWLFGFDFVLIEGADSVIQIATGKAVT